MISVPRWAVAVGLAIVWIVIVACAVSLIVDYFEEKRRG